jgi:hypothetical protein
MAAHEFSASRSITGIGATGGVLSSNVMRLQIDPVESERADHPIRGAHHGSIEEVVFCEFPRISAKANEVPPVADCCRFAHRFELAAKVPCAELCVER